MAKKPITIQFPFGGLNRRYGYQSQPPYTTPDCLNVRPIDSIEGRQRGGMRPGLKKTFEQQIGTGNPIRMMANVTSTGTTVSEWILSMNNAEDFELNAVFDKTGANLLLTTDPVIWPYIPEGLTFTQTIPSIAPADRELIFRSLDGFMGVTSIAIKDSYLNGALPDMSPFLNLETLDLSGNSLTGSTSDLSDLTKLKILNLSGNTGFTWGTLPPALTELYYIDDASDSAVRNVNWTTPVGLTTVELWNCNASLTGEGTIIPQTSLQSLKLRYYIASNNTMTKLSFYAKPTLETLDMAYCHLKGEFLLGYFGLSGYTPFQNLETLNISNNSLTSFTYNSNFEYAAKITSFDFSNNSFNAAAVDSILQIVWYNAFHRTESSGHRIPLATVNLRGNAYPTTETGNDFVLMLRDVGWTVDLDE